MVADPVPWLFVAMQDQSPASSLVALTMVRSPLNGWNLIRSVCSMMLPSFVQAKVATGCAETLQPILTLEPTTKFCDGMLGYTFGSAVNKLSDKLLNVGLWQETKMEKWWTRSNENKLKHIHSYTPSLFFHPTHQLQPSKPRREFH